MDGFREARTYPTCASLGVLSRVNHSCRSCCLIQKCYRNFSTWGPSRPALIPALQRSRHGLTSRGVDQLFGHDAAPLLHPALQRTQVSPAEPIRFSLLQSAQQYHRTGVRVFLQLNQSQGEMRRRMG